MFKCLSVTLQKIKDLFTVKALNTLRRAVADTVTTVFQCHITVNTRPEGQKLNVSLENLHIYTVLSQLKVLTQHVQNTLKHSGMFQGNMTSTFSREFGMT